MSTKYYSIGEAARLCGISVRRLRFYSDKGILPEPRRTQTGYRIYSDADLARVQLLVQLRRVGVPLAGIGNLLTREVGLAEVLRMRLEALEAQIASQTRVASALKVALAQPSPSPKTLEKAMTMMATSEQQVRARIEAAVAKIAEGSTMSEAEREKLVQQALPPHPDDPTPEQAAAWDEIMALLADSDFLEQGRENARKIWDGNTDMDAYQAAAGTVMAAAMKAAARGTAPTSPEGQAIADDWLARSAAALGRPADAQFVAWHLDQMRQMRSSRRYWQLLAILKGEPAPDTRWQDWLEAAIAAL